GAAQVEYDAVVRFLLDQLQRLATSGRYRDVDIVVPEQLANTQLLRRIIFHYQEPLASGRCVVLDPSQRDVKVVGARGLSDKRKCTSRQAVTSILIERQHLYRNVPGCGILFGVVQD